MPVRIAWDQYEVALLIDAYLRIESGANPDEVAASLSKTLRTLAQNRGIAIDETYRNVNGMKMQLADVRYLFTGGRSGLTGASDLMRHMHYLYVYGRAAFDSILDSAKRMSQEWILSELKAWNLRYNDKRSLGGCLWIAKETDIDGFINECCEHGYHMHLKPDGCKAFPNLAVWWTTDCFDPGSVQYKPEPSSVDDVLPTNCGEGLDPTVGSDDGSESSEKQDVAAEMLSASESCCVTHADQDDRQDASLASNDSARAFIANFNVSREPDELVYFYENGKATNIDYLLADFKSGKTNWSVPKSAVPGDIIVFMCAKGARRNLGAAIHHLSASRKKAYKRFLDKQKELYQKYSGFFLGYGIVASNPVQDMPGTNWWMADIKPIHRFPKPVHIDSCKSFITINSFGSITRLHADQWDQLRKVVDQLNPGFFENAVSSDDFSSEQGSETAQQTAPSDEQHTDDSEWRAYKQIYPAAYEALRRNPQTTLREFLGINVCENADTSVLPLSVRSFNCIRRNIKAEATISDLLDARLTSLIAMRNAGAKTIREIIDQVSAYAQSHTGSSTGGAENADAGALSPAIDLRRFEQYTDLIREEKWDEIEQQLTSDEDVETVLRLMDLAEVIGADMTAEAIGNPYVLRAFLPSLRDWLQKAERTTTRINGINMLLSALDPAMRELPVQPFIIASDSIDRQALLEAVDDESLTFSQLPEVISEFEERTDQVLRRFLQWCIKLNVPEEIDQMLNACLKNERRESVIRLRAQGKTLEETGAVYQLTRERIRQVEKKAINAFDMKQGGMILQKIAALRGGDETLTPAEIAPYAGERADLFLYLLRNSEEPRCYHYSRQLDAFILGNRSKLDLVQRYVDGLPDRIDADAFDGLLDQAEADGLNPEMVGLQIQADYSFVDSIRIWQRGRVKRLDMAAEVLRSFDPDGIHVYSQDEMNEFRRRLYKKYGTEIRRTDNDHALATLISKAGILRDRGTYVAMRPCPIPDELLQRIRDYIEDDRTTVYMFTALFEAFQDDLIRCGVDNRYYLQGILKSLWGDLYSFSKDYLSQGERVVGVYDLVDDYVRKAGGVVTMEDLHNAFPGVTDTVLGFALQQKTILSMFGKYLHVSNLRLSEDDTAKLHGILSALVADGQAHTSDELYQRATREGSAWLDQLDIPYPQALFSVVTYLFGEEFAFARPWVAARGTLGEERVRYWQTRRSRDKDEESDSEPGDETSGGQAAPPAPQPAVDPETVSRINTILSEEFPDGLRLIGMRLRRFRNAYEEHYHEEIEPDDDKLVALLKSVCDFREERIFAGHDAGQNSLLNGIAADVMNTLSAGATCIYPQQLFAKYREALADEMAVYTADALWPLLQSLPGNQLRLVGGLICLNGKRPNTDADVRSLFRDTHTPLNYAQLQERLWYIPLGDIKYELRRERSIVNIDMETYFYAPNFPISTHELASLKRAIARRIEDDGYLVAKGLRQLMKECCPSASTDTAGWPDWGIRNVMAYLLRDDFDFKGAIIAAKGSGFDIPEAFRSFCRARERVRVEELKDLCKELDTNAIYWYPVFEEMVRISGTELVRKDGITFDVEATDRALQQFCPGKYKPIKEFTLFMLLPPVGVPWNSFLLESYLRHYSRVFWLNQGNPNEYAAVGAMVRRGSGIHDYRELIVDALAHDDSWETLKDALSFLAEKGYRTQRTITNGDELIKAARLLREQLHAAEK